MKMMTSHFKIITACLFYILVLSLYLIQLFFILNLQIIYLKSPFLKLSLSLSLSLSLCDWQYSSSFFVAFNSTKFHFLIQIQIFFFFFFWISQVIISYLFKYKSFYYFMSQFVGHNSYSYLFSPYWSRLFDNFVLPLSHEDLPIGCFPSLQYHLTTAWIYLLSVKLVTCLAQ